VLCRIDAYADYIAVVEADSAQEAAEFAFEDHNLYAWKHVQTAEFDDRLYVTLDELGEEIDSTRVGDF
jgi:hypothetical protein